MLTRFVPLRQPARPADVIAPVFTLAAILSLLAPSAARAQALADRVPADTVLYVGWAGADRLGPAYQNSRLKAVLDATDAKQLDQFVGQLMQKLGQQQPDAAEAAQAGKIVAGLARPIWRHPTAFYFGGVNWEGQPGPTPRVALVTQAGEDAGQVHEQVLKLMHEGLKDAPPEVKDLIKITREGEFVTVSVGYADEKQGGIVAQAKDTSLLAGPAFKAALVKAAKDPAFVFYLDAERLLTLINTAVEREGDEDPRRQWPKVRDATGLAGVKQVMWASGFDGRDWTDQLFVGAPEPRKGLLTLLDAPPVTDAALSVIPQTATLAGVTRFDAAKLITTLRQTAGELDPDAAAQIDQGLKQVSAALKMDLQKDLLEALGDEWAYYSAPDVGGRGVLGLVLVNRLRDPAKATTSLANLEAFANAQMAEATRNEEFKLAIYTTKHENLTIRYVGLPLVTPAWAIQDGNLYVGLYPQVVASAAGHVSAKGKTILDNPDFVAMRKRVVGGSGGDAKPSSIAFADLPRTAPDAYGQWLMISRLAGFGDMLGVQSPPMLLPPLGKLLAQLTPAGSAIWTDKDGWHARAVSPFPGAQALSTDPLGGAMVLPALIGAAAEQRVELQAEIDPPAAGKAAPRVEP